MKGVYAALIAINEALKKVEKFLGCVCLGTLFVVMIVNAALRYCFQSGLNWSDELNGFLFVWMGFLAAAHATSCNAHLNITAIVQRLPGKVQYLLRTGTNLVVLAMYVLYLPSLNKLMNTLPISNVMRIPLRYVYAILPISFCLMSYHICMNILGDVVALAKLKEERLKADVTNVEVFE